jgi:hypothetical protein
MATMARAIPVVIDTTTLATSPGLRSVGAVDKLSHVLLSHGRLVRLECSLQKGSDRIALGRS